MDTDFDEVVTDLACEDGVEFLITIPGVWEAISEFYNNDALRVLAEQAEDNEDDD